MKSKILGLLAVGLLTGSVSAQAVPTLWAGNGHYYEYISGVPTWDAARAAALGSTYMGMSGYLATITSAQENAFVYSLLTAAGGSGGWLGGSDATTEGTWVWVDGPEAGTVFWNGGVGGLSPTYANWDSGEPNDPDFGVEDHLQMTTRQSGRWNDLNSSSTYLLTGYFVEYSVPEPGTLALLGLGLLGLGVSRRKA